VRYALGDKLQNLVYDNGGRIQQTYRSMLATPNTPIIYSTSTYSYDNLDRITNQVIDTANPTNSTGYAYDLSGNRTNLNLGANQYPSTIASTSNRLTADTGSINRTYTYDGTGNTTGDGQDTYSYYANGRLKQVTRSGSTLAQYQYNGMGELVKKTNSSNLATYYLYDTEHHLIGEYDQNGQPIQSYIYLGDIPVAVLKGGAGNVQDKLFYIYTDHLNTPREIRNHANQTRWTWYPEQSGAFGDGQPNDSPSALGIFTFNLRFPGQLYDVATQLSYNYYRDYNPRTGRYIESDPIGLAGGINTYGYANQNPLSYIDPDGRFFFLPIIAGLAGGGASGAGATAATLGVLGVGSAVTWGLQHPAIPSGSANSDPFANAGADSSSSSSSASDSKKDCGPDKPDCKQAKKECIAVCFPLIGKRGTGFTDCIAKCMDKKGCSQYNPDWKT